MNAGSAMAGTLLYLPPVNPLCVYRACTLSRYSLSQRRLRSNTVNRCGLSLRNPVLKVSEEVRDAINQDKPVVALESTIYTHVM